MSWWQVCLVVSVCAFWTLFAVSVGVGHANKINLARDVADQAKWQVPGQ